MQVQIKCKGSFATSLESLEVIQGDLKELSEENYNKLKSQILELGFSAPFFVWKKSETELKLLDGTQRNRALICMKEEGITMPEEFPCVEIEAKNLKEAKKKILAISSNYGTMTTLGLESFMEDVDMKLDDVANSFTFDAIDFDVMAKEIPVEQLAPVEGEDDVPEIQPDPIAKRGDVWLLGDHRVMCGDSTMIDDVEKLMNGSIIDLVHTDPPYGINESGDRVKRSKNGLAKGSNLVDFIDDSTSYASDAYNLCEGLGIKKMVWWGANYYSHTVPEGNNWIVWDKRLEDKQKDYNSDCEVAFVKSKWNSIRIFRHLWKGMIKGSEHGEKRVHPTQKPVALAEFVFDYFKMEFDTVMDLFGGSGITLIASEKSGKVSFTMELSEQYMDVIIKRWQKFTDKEATLESTGQTFNELFEARK